jgi:hypothetical protein
LEDDGVLRRRVGGCVASSSRLEEREAGFLEAEAHSARLVAISHAIHGRTNGVE